MKKLSVIIPSYNDEKIIEKKILKLIAKLKRIKVKFEIIIINDGSIDNTLSVLKKVRKNIKNILIINNIKNLGKSRSVKQGLQKSKNKNIILIDSDLPYFEVLPKILLKLNQNYDFVFVNRRHKKSVIKNKKLNFYQLGRFLIGYILSLVIKFTLNFDLNGVDTQSGLKGFKKSEDFKKLNFISEKFFLDLEMMFHYKMINKKFFAIPVKYEIPHKSSIKLFSFKKNLVILKELFFVISKLKKKY